MTATKIKTYLKMLMEIEKQEYTQEKLIAELENTIQCLGQRRNFRQPEGLYGETWDNPTINSLAIGICAVGLGMWIKFLRIPFMVIGVLFLISAAAGMLESHFEYKKQEEKHRQAVENYESAIRQDSVRVENELKRKVFLQAELKNLKDTNEKTKIRLNKLYAMNIIHPQYRGLIPICSLYGYFDTGVCSTLEGHEGAYNKYDTESRLDYIICKMEEVVKRLDDIKSNQYQLYAAIKDSDAKYDKLISNTNGMMRQLDGIHAQGSELNSRVADLQLTSALTLYEADCSRRELQYLNQIHSY